MSKQASVVVTIYDDETHKVLEHLYFPKSSSYAWEVSRLFYQIGETVARKIDPQYYEQEPK